MKGDVMLKIKLADLGEELQLAKDLYTSIEKHGRAKFERFMEGELKPNARLLTPSLIYLLMFAGQEIMFEAQKTLQSDRAKHAASSPRKPEDKTEASVLWEAWQDNPYTYPNKQQFIADVMLKCEVSPKTARTWFDEFRTHACLEWEASFGKKYKNL